MANVHRENHRVQLRSSSLVQLGPRAVIDAGVILGYAPSREVGQRLVIGPAARIRQGTIIYGGSDIGRNLETGHNVIIREQNRIGDNLCIWSNSIIDYGCKIGNNVKVHNNVYVAQFTIIEDNVFLAPGVSLANDIHPGCPDAARCLKGPHIKNGAQVGVNSCILPRVTVGEYALVGAGSVVTRDVPPRGVAYGNPARVVGTIEDLVCTSGLRDKPYGHLIERFQNANRVR